MSGEEGDQALTALYFLACLVLVLSAFAVRRVPVGSGLKMAAAWALIFLAAFAGFALKDDFLALGQRLVQEGRGEERAVEKGGELRIRKAEDGHFWATARVNGTRVRFLIDSGATTTSLSAETARRVGVEPSGGGPALVQTANGVVRAERGRIARLAVGPIERRDVAVQYSEAFGDMDVLGMNFLSSLSRWGVEGAWLVLRP